jgi:hypothetical protein
VTPQLSLLAALYVARDDYLQLQAALVCISLRQRRLTAIISFCSRTLDGLER